MVSVCVHTFQHKNFITSCIEGILSQQTSFPFELLIGDDSSADGTREICLDYAKRYPGKIRLFLHHRENNIRINGSPSGRYNFIYNLNAARGKYIAICEGDDSWTDPRKLQKQVDILEADDSVSLVFHNVLEKKNDQSLPMIDGLKPGYIDKQLIFQKAIRIPTLSQVFRKKNIIFTPVLEQIVSGDRYFELLNATKGRAWYIDEIMGIKNTLQSGMIYNYQKSKKNRYDFLKAQYQSNLLILGILDKEYRKYIHRYLLRLCYSLVRSNPLASFRYVLFYFRHLFSGI